MATQRYQRDPTEAAKGDAKNTGAPGATPSPTKPYAFPLDRGLPAKVRTTDYGTNQWAGPSSIPPGSDVSADFKAQSADPVLDIVKNRGIRNDSTADDDQLRKIGSGNVPTHSAMRGAAPGPKIPGSIDASATEEPVRQPTIGK